MARASITPIEQDVIRAACECWGWQDHLDLDAADEGIAAVGWFQITKRTESKTYPAIGRVRHRDVTVWTLEETVIVNGGPGEPDCDDLREFDEIEGIIYDALEACRVQEHRWSARCDLEAISWDVLSDQLGRPR